jgi:hypothetical protein
VRRAATTDLSRHRDGGQGRASVRGKPPHTEIAFGHEIDAYRDIKSAILGIGIAASSVCGEIL